MKKKYIMKTILVTFVITLSLAVIGFSYAYFSTEITGEGKYVTLDTGDLRLKYTDNTVLSLDNALPGDSVTKTFTVENIGTKKVSYNIVWNNLINTINNYDLHLDMKCKSYKNYNTTNQVEEGECDSFYKAVPYTETSISKDIKRNNEIDVGITHEYTITITFKNRSYNQKDNLNKQFSGKINLEEYIDSSPEAIYCTYDGELTQGAEYVNGQYTYRYKQQGKYTSSGIAWQDILSDGWGVQLTDKTSAESVTSDLCTYINNKPVVSMSYMFYNSKATTLDLSNFNTNNVTNMNSMFWNSSATTLDVSDFNTSNVTNMYGMFWNSSVTTLDVSNFDTSNVTNMSSMFLDSKATTLDLSSFNTSNVTKMFKMFQSNQAKTLDLSSFDTSNVTDVKFMFSDSKVTMLDVSNFDTSNVTDMSSMFSSSQATTLDLSNFDTSNVTDMSAMFSGSKVTTLDVSNFDTSNVINMRTMFYNSKATIIDLSNFDTSNVTNMNAMFSSSTLNTIYVSNKFNTDKVTSSISMFDSCTNLVGGAGTKYDANHIDKEYARIDGGTSSPGYFTLKTN